MRCLKISSLATIGTAWARIVTRKMVGKLIFKSQDEMFRVRIPARFYRVGSYGFKMDFALLDLSQMGPLMTRNNLPALSIA